MTSHTSSGCHDMDLDLVLESPKCITGFLAFRSQMLQMPEEPSAASICCTLLFHCMLIMSPMFCVLVPGEYTPGVLGFVMSHTQSYKSSYKYIYTYVSCYWSRSEQVVLLLVEIQCKYWPLMLWQVGENAAFCFPSTFTYTNFTLTSVYVERSTALHDRYPYLQRWCHCLRQPTIHNITLQYIPCLGCMLHVGTCQGHQLKTVTSSA